MALVSAWNATTDENAIYAPGGKTGKLFTQAGNTSAIITDVTAISGKSIEMTGTGTKGVTWTARRNSSGNRGQAFLVRFSPTYTGAPAGRKVIWSMTALTNRVRIELSHEATTGNVALTILNESSVTIVNGVSFGAWTTNTSGNWYDLGFSTTGDTTSSGTKFVIDAVLLGSITPTGSLTASWDNEIFSELSFGTGTTVGGAIQKYEEWGWYDTAVDFTANIALASGNGLANGAARTSLISNVAGAALTVLDGYNTTDPGEGNVLTTAGNYIISGVTKTPTYVKVAAANVRLSTAFGAASAETGLAAIPVAGDVRDGTATDQTNGTAHIPAAGDVRLSVNVDATTGTVVIPDAGDVRLGTAFDTASIGTLAVGTTINNNLQRVEGVGVAKRLHGVIR